jgi:hypothetical protein
MVKQCGHSLELAAAAGAGFCRLLMAFTIKKMTKAIIRKSTTF